MTLEEAVGAVGGTQLRGFAKTAAEAFPGLVEKVVLLLPVHPAPDFPRQVAVILRMQRFGRDEEQVAALREVHRVLGTLALPATMEGHSIQLYVVPTHEQEWVVERLPRGGAAARQRLPRIPAPSGVREMEEGERRGRFVMIRDSDGRLHALSATSVSVVCEDVDGGCLLLIPGGRMIRSERALEEILDWLALGATAR